MNVSISNGWRLWGMGLLGVCLLTWSVLASADLAAAPKIGVVDMTKVLQGSGAGIKVSKLIKEAFKSKEAVLLKKEKEHREKREMLQRNAAIMGEAERMKLEEEVLSVSRELKRLKEEYREDFIRRQNVEVGKLMHRIQDEVNKIAKTGSYDFILHSDVVLFSSDKVDITQLLMDHLDG